MRANRGVLGGLDDEEDYRNEISSFGKDLDQFGMTNMTLQRHQLSAILEAEGIADCQTEVMELMSGELGRSLFPVPEDVFQRVSSVEYSNELTAVTAFARNSEGPTIGHLRRLVPERPSKNGSMLVNVIDVNHNNHFIYSKFELLPCTACNKLFFLLYRMLDFTTISSARVRQPHTWWRM